jgi:hypothetical protein
MRGEITRIQVVNDSTKTIALPVDCCGFVAVEEKVPDPPVRIMFRVQCPGCKRVRVGPLSWVDLGRA